MATAPINPLALVGVDCPACRTRWYCEDGCVCPVCWPDRFTDSTDDSLRQWAQFAPVLAAMNEENITWGWSTSYSKPTVHSIEATIDDRRLAEVSVSGGKFHAEYCEYDKRDNFWNVKYSESFTHPQDVVAWINRFR